MVNLSAKTEYACRALLELALHWPNPQPLSISEISARRKIPQKFLIHILLNLKQSKFVDSVRGKEGGYILAIPPAEINLGRVAQIFSELKNDVRSPQKNVDVIATAWAEAAGLMVRKLEGVTFAELAALERERVKTAMYSI